MRGIRRCTLRLRSAGRTNASAPTQDATKGGTPALRPCFDQLWIGNVRILFLVAAYMALQSAGARGGSEGSPIPVGVSLL